MIRRQEVYLIGQTSINEKLLSNITPVLENVNPNFCIFQQVVKAF